MKIITEEVLISKGYLSGSRQLEEIMHVIREAISKVVWPIDSTNFTINPTPKGNGVKPIKNFCMQYLQKNGWELEHPLKLATELKPGPLDATLKLSDDTYFAVEWETGNISSSHRAINKMILGINKQVLSGGVLILPSRKMYNYLTDRIGNFKELRPYFDVWKQYQINNGYLAIIEIEHDHEDKNVQLISKGTDGYALYKRH